MVGGRVRKRRCLGEGPMTGWLWQPGRGTPKLYNTPTPQIGADRCMQKSLPVGTFLNRSLPSIGRGLNAIPQKSPCQPNLLECSRLGTRFQVPILYALTLLARVSQVETLCPHRVSFAL